MRYDAVVIGGGLLGGALTWMLAREGASVLLLEKDQLNQHASGQNAGSLHFQLEYRMVENGWESARTAAAAMPLHLDAAEAWTRLGDELGESVGVVQRGGFMLAETAEQVAVLERKVGLEQEWGLDVTLLDGAEARRIAPYLSESVIAAAFCPIEGKAETRTAGPALVRGAVKLGAEVRTHTRVTGLERDAHGWKVTAAGPDSTLSIHADTVMIAAGVWTTELGALAGADLPTIPLALMMSVSAPVEPFIGHLIQHAGAKLSLKQTQNGTVLIGGGWPAALSRSAGSPDLETRPRLLPESIVGNARAAIGVVPGTARLPIVRSWAGTTTITPDQLPLVGEVPGCPGMFVATGGSAFTLGPSFARSLCDLAAGRTPHIDLRPYAPDRFGVMA
ncbi:NAD(P)/FAD-dependent oxidoreductase [Microbacterium sp. B19(2022)]|uniref:NAD(P)/FAD-dependent oxidoreductase n=1 Tax=Microbacterium sp. B19(2022) TaxID=2914045 RepID=UPI001F2B07CA|nr:FAD-binding oxidoreductase [Microbacterium sp. B19(2022)]